MRPSAPVVLVADIDRGGAFAHLHGTWSLVTDGATAPAQGLRAQPLPWRPRAAASRSAGRSRTRPAMRYLGRASIRSTTAFPTRTARRRRRAAATVSGSRIVRYPTASNLDEFKPLEQVAARDLGRSAQTSSTTLSLVVLPGSKHVAADLDWLRETGLAARIKAHAAAGRPVLGICGGLQMLGGADRRRRRCRRRARRARAAAGRDVVRSPRSSRRLHGSASTGSPQPFAALGRSRGRRLRHPPRRDDRRR